MPDQNTTVLELRTAVEHFVSARDWHAYHAPKNLAMSIAIEAAELMEHFQWHGPEDGSSRMDDAGERAAVAEEIADVVIYLLSFCNATGIDLSDAVQAKLARNEGRFPVEQVRGRLG